jgi:hypothetical protein
MTMEQLDNYVITSSLSCRYLYAAGENERKKRQLHIDKHLSMFVRDVNTFPLLDHVADVNVETLIAAYHSIRNTWHQETLVSAQRIPSLIRGSTLTQKNQLSNLLLIEASSLQISSLPDSHGCGIPRRAYSGPFVLCG